MTHAWQIEVGTLAHVVDAVGHRVEENLRWLGLPATIRVTTRRLFFVVGAIDRDAADRLATELLADPVVEKATAHDHAQHRGAAADVVSVFRKPGVMDPAEASIRRAAARMGIVVDAARTGTAYRFTGGLDAATLKRIGESLLANAAIEDIHVGDDHFPAPRTPAPVKPRRTEVPLTKASDDRLVEISRTGGLSLTLPEMQTIRAHFAELGREPTDLELESLAQTWSEHCKHKTFTSAVRYEGRVIDNLLKATIKQATTQLARPFCLSVFHDNAGVIRFDDTNALCIKVETHNHPSAIEPYGGAGTGLGGVIRDILGTGRGAKPVANMDVFCVGPLDLPQTALPKGTLHPLRVLRGVVAGVRDYGNQMGIPTVAGGLFFDERYLGNPLVYAGTVGLMPVDAVTKSVQPGDLVVALGGRTGRDGIHGATFSSLVLHEDSERVDAGAVQIGNAITEKKVADVVIAARNRDLFRSITDCGAGGFSSAVGEMGAETGVRIELSAAPLKYPGLTSAEIWISEAQERMVLAVPPDRLTALLALCRDEDVEAAVLGEFTNTHRLEVRHDNVLLADVDMEFLHDGVPKTIRDAVWTAPAAGRDPAPPAGDFTADVLAILAEPNVCSREWIIRQYDHEVLSGSAVKPLVGTRSHGPSDAAVVAPVLGSARGFALGTGMNPRYGDHDPLAMAEAAIDEALRNVVAVGGDPDATAILDNFSWGNCARPEALGALVRCSIGCRDTAIALGTPFVSGKDSLNNEYQAGGKTVSIPHSLLVTALSIVPDVRCAVTMDLKRPGHTLFVVGETVAELGGSHWAKIHGVAGARVPRINGARAKRVFAALHSAIQEGLVRSCHDLSEGGLAVAAAEMVLAGEVGAAIDLTLVPVADATAKDAAVDDGVRAFSESLTRFLVEVEPIHASRFTALMAGLPCAAVGKTTTTNDLVLTGRGGTRVHATAAALEAAWRPPITAHLEGRRATTEARS